MKTFYLILISLLSLTTCSKTPKGAKVLIETSYGNIKVSLYDETPLHRDNFVKLVNEGYYNGKTFHRVIKHFMIQGGATNTAKDSVLNEDDLIPSEINTSKYIHKAGALAAARWGNDENPKKMSDAAQFYIVSGAPVLEMDFETIERERIENLNYEILYTNEQKDIYKSLGGAPHLDGEYTVFGEVYEGLDIVKKIERVETNEINDKPLNPVIIKRMTLILDDK